MTQYIDPPEPSDKFAGNPLDAQVGFFQEKKSEQLASLLEELGHMIEDAKSLVELIGSNPEERANNKTFLIDPNPGAAEAELARILMQFRMKAGQTQILAAQLSFQSVTPPTSPVAFMPGRGGVAQWSPPSGVGAIDIQPDHDSVAAYVRLIADNRRSEFPLEDAHWEKLSGESERIQLLTKIYEDHFIEPRRMKHSDYKENSSKYGDPGSTLGGEFGDQAGPSLF